MQLIDRVQAFTKLGLFLNLFKTEEVLLNNSCDELFYNKFKEKMSISVYHNGWFTEENVQQAVDTWAETLSEESVEKWVKVYDFSKTKTKTVGIVTAGNIPLVGFHDFISVLMAGHKVLVKQSSNDQHLLPILADYLIRIEPRFKDKILFTEGRLNDFDAVIATGSNNTSRYFEHYFGEHPNIIRMSRNGVAIIQGDETQEQLAGLGEDIFRYFGLGCRSVSKIFVPKDYDFDKLFKAIFNQKNIIEYRKYKNNYDYNKTIYLMSQIKLIENGFLLLKEETSYASPIATLFYEYYDSLPILKQRLDADKEQIQCVVSNKLTKESIPFGETQKPMLWEYADGVDTMEFLLDL